MKKPSQPDQVIAALKSIGGRGTAKEIYKATPGADTWGKTPENSIMAILVRHKDIRKEDKVWVYEENILPQNLPSTNSMDSTTQGKIVYSGLYLITPQNGAKKLIKTFVFKIGESGNIKNRIRDWYNRVLPIPLVEVLSYHVVPTGIDRERVEKQVRATLLKEDSLGFRIEECFEGYQREWFKISDAVVGEDKIAKLIQAFHKITDEAVANLLKAN